MRTFATILISAAATAMAWSDDGSCAPKPIYDASELALASTPATKILLTDAAQKTGAVCLDGTPSAYYFHEGTDKTKWYIHHQGGGWCESLDDCKERAGTDLGSSKDYPPTADLGDGYFSTDPAINPMMYDWNMVFMRYCDGGSFSGNNETVTPYEGVDLHFRGKRILDAMIDDLLTNKTLNQATDVVVSGCSAGGLATYLHCDYWRTRLPQTAKQVCLPDSGFFLDVENPIVPGEEEETNTNLRGNVGTTVPGNYHDGLVWVFNQMNSTDGVNAECIEKENPTENCIFAEISSLYIHTPTFPLQSQHDSWQIGHVLTPNPSDALVNAMGVNITNRLTANLLSHDNHGVFLDAKTHHCGEWDTINPIYGFDGWKQSTAFTNFYYNISTRRIFFQNASYPCNDC